MAMIPYDVGATGFFISFQSARPGVRGLTFSYEGRIEIYVRSSDQPFDLAHVIAHEIGHAVDIAFNSSDDRVRWLSQRGLPADHPWWPGGVSDFASGAGDFAECFASWAVGSPSYSQAAGACDSGALTLMGELAAG